MKNFKTTVMNKEIESRYFSNGRYDPWKSEIERTKKKEQMKTNKPFSASVPKGYSIDYWLHLKRPRIASKRIVEDLLRK